MLSTFVNSFVRNTRFHADVFSKQIYDINVSASRSFVSKATGVKQASTKGSSKKVVKPKALPKTLTKAKPKKSVKPKRVLSAYNLYVKEQFPKYKQRDAQAKAPQIMTQLSQAWKRLSETEKSPYSQSAAALKKQKDEQVELKKANRGPLNGYAQFVKDNFSKVRNQNPTISASDVIKKLAVMWKNLPPTDRSRRLKDASSAREQFKKMKSGS
eukprot:TRINITY_DN1713_c0_g1_i4.p1 TRINITY_DN1713_c0_g1~~TRINITY_DN1713_c0_g1_i4.p1  ORF type:complete len:213 (-),score=18.77 TRINITY_DN1713_c0_g1_i4:281-919(-)